MAKRAPQQLDYLTEAGVTYRRLGDGKYADDKCGEREFRYVAVNSKRGTHKIVNVVAVVGDEIDMLRLLNHWNRHVEMSGYTYYTE